MEAGAAHTLPLSHTPCLSLSVSVCVSVSLPLSFCLSLSHALTLSHTLSLSHSRPPVPQVDGDFNAIFSTLLPGTSARLSPPAGGSFLDGLEVRWRRLAHCIALGLLGAGCGMHVRRSVHACMHPHGGVRFSARAHARFAHAPALASRQCSHTRVRASHSAAPVSSSRPSAAATHMRARTCVSLAAAAQPLPCALSPASPLAVRVQVRVAFGGVWKESLTELSGGQRSLLALSLVLALCRCAAAALRHAHTVSRSIPFSPQSLTCPTPHSPLSLSHSLTLTHTRSHSRTPHSRPQVQAGAALHPGRGRRGARPQPHPKHRRHD